MTLEREATWVKDEHRSPNPECSTFSGVASRGNDRIALTRAALNNLPICACDIPNDNLQVSSSEKHYVVCVS